MRRSDIYAVGTVGETEDGRPVLQNWNMRGGDFGYYVGPDGQRLGGWSVDELRVIFILWNAHRFPLPIPGDQFGPAPDPPIA